MVPLQIEHEECLVLSFVACIPGQIHTPDSSNIYFGVYAAHLLRYVFVRNESRVYKATYRIRHLRFPEKDTEVSIWHPRNLADFTKALT